MKQQMGVLRKYYTSLVTISTLFKYIESISAPSRRHRQESVSGRDR